MAEPAAVVPIVPIVPIIESFASNLEALQSFTSKWFHSPDLEAQECCLTAAASHLVTTAEPIWPIVVGPSGTGKTTICVMSFHGLDAPYKSYLVGDITPSTLISGKRGASNSLLHRIGSGLLLMKDFTTIMSKRETDRNEIVGQLREVYDGAFSRQSGNGPSTPWSGKITLIGAATPAVYRAWHILRELGERFCFINWPKADDAGVAFMVDKQINCEREIAKTIQSLTRKALLSVGTTLPPLPMPSSSQGAQLRAMAIVAARCRTHVTRDSSGKREIIEVAQSEGIGRLYKSLSLLARVHAALHNRATLDADDVRIARRVAKDAIPVTRQRLLQHIPGGSDIAQPALHHLTKVPMSTIDWNMEELVALEIAEKAPIEYENRYNLHPQIEEQMILAGFCSMSK